MKHVSLKKVLVTTSILFYAQFALAVPKLIPVINGQLTMGQWYFESQKSSLGGNASLNVIPAIRYTNKFTLIPSFSTSYRGTRSAEELAGGNTLFQDTWENGFNLKAVHGVSQKLKIRENMGARMKWYRETRNENWNKGLYDYRTFNVGVEAEYSWSKKLSAALAYDYSYLQFPNYESLEASQSSDNSREYAAENPLDQQIHLMSIRVNMPLTWSLTSNFQGFVSPRTYQSQTVVDLSGVLLPEKRSDLFVGGTLSVERIFNTSSSSRLVPSVFVGYSGLDSNQNHYDASVTKFISDFYDYDQQRLGGQLSYVFGKNPTGPMVAEASYVYSSRDYRSRVIQSVDGVYLNEKLNLTDTQLSLGFSYPLSKNFRMKVSSTFGHSESNNQYEQVYQYNYSNSNYQFGVTYEY